MPLFGEYSNKPAFDAVKNLLIKAPHLAFYAADRPTMISVDSSSYGLGGVILQQQVDQKWRPVSYVSRSLTASERNYSNIEREALAVAWCCDRLKEFIIGKEVIVETDHKPLLTIFKTRNLDDLTP